MSRMNLSMASRRIGWGKFSSSAKAGRLGGDSEVAFELRLQGDSLVYVLGRQPRIELDDRINLKGPAFEETKASSSAAPGDARPPH